MSGNGVDIGHLAVMLESVIAAQERMRVEVHAGLNEVRNEVRIGLAAVNRRVDDLTDQVSSLRQTVTDYHGSVMGHGMLITELDSRLTRVEHHLDLPPQA